MVSVEMAAALPVLVVLMLTGVYAVRVVDARARCLDTAREVARFAARGDPRAVELGHRMLPSARISLSRSGVSVTAVVSVRVSSGGSSVPAVTVAERATAAAEALPNEAGAPP